MTRKARVILLAIAFLLAQNPSFGWKFASFADSRGSNNGVNTAELSKIVNRINLEGVDIALFQGDAVSGYCDDACLSSQMDTWLSVMANLNCPWYFCPGNHELESRASSENVLRNKLDQPTNGPPGHLEMVYSFDYANAHFVSLNSNHYGEQHKVQRSWLASDLGATTQPHIFVMAHEPGYPKGPHIGSSLDVYPSERDDFWNIMSRAGVGVYFCGHEHLYARSKQGAIFQVINGTCGAPIATGYPGTNPVYSYVIVEIDGYRVSCQAKNDTGTVIDSWTYTVAPTCDSLKFIPDGSTVILKNKMVTYSSASFAYVQEDDRSSGFKIAGATGVSTGSRISVSGTLQTTADAERQVSGVVSVISTGNPLPRPVGLTTPALLGAARGYNPGATGAFGLNNSSMLVRVFGKVTKASSGMFYVDDGAAIMDGTSFGGTANVGVRVISSAPVAEGQYAVVTGICTAFRNGEQVCRQIYAVTVD